MCPLPGETEPSPLPSTPVLTLAFHLPGIATRIGSSIAISQLMRSRAKAPSSPSTPSLSQCSSSVLPLWLQHHSFWLTSHTVQDELEYRSDGTKKVVRPSRLSLARVSVLRGSGPAEEVPFIDDHIHTSEPVVDYLTDFSGIHSQPFCSPAASRSLLTGTHARADGDLDPHVSQHTLVPLKVAYKKLRLLLDLGCVFIGHGLKVRGVALSCSRPSSATDSQHVLPVPRKTSGSSVRALGFKTNAASFLTPASSDIFVPSDQVCDTVDLYYNPTRQRKISLRFLSWFLLKNDIQTGEHDSIEVSALSGSVLLLV